MATRTSCLEIVKNLSDTDIETFDQIRDEYIAKGETNADVMAAQDTIDLVLRERSEAVAQIEAKGGKVEAYSKADSTVDYDEVETDSQEAANVLARLLSGKSFDKAGITFDKDGKFTTVKSGDKVLTYIEGRKTRAAVIAGLRANSEGFESNEVVEEKTTKEVTTYPTASIDEWYGDADYKARGGELINMTPDEYLDQVRPLDIDEVSRENIDDLKQHIQSGKTLDPLAIYEDGSEDGRHRAVAAKELGIKSVPVIKFPQNAAPAETKKTPEKASATSEEEEKNTPLADTSDVGDELTYNKRSQGITVKTLQNESNDTKRLALAVKPKLWKRPDYQEMVDGGVKPVIAHIVKQVYDAIPNKPAYVDDKYIYAYAEVIDDTKKAIDSILTNKPKMAAIVGAISQKAAQRSQAYSGTPVDIMDNQNKDFSALQMLFNDVFPKNEEGARWGSSNPEGNVRALAMGGRKFARALEFDLDSFIKALKAVQEDGFPAKMEAWQRSYKIIEEGGTFKLSKKKYRSIISEHKTREEAVEAARDKVSRTKKDKFKEPDTPIEKSMREGGDVRDGQNISSEKLKNTVGLRGVNFGNWMKKSSSDKERQAHINSAYDAFHDLAEILDVPVKALSLNGMLGLAIGAQGKGSYAAHFIAGVNEINLTRMKGAGSLAHEFAHGLDHYFAVLAGKSKDADPFLSDKTYASKDAEIRPEIMDAFKSLMHTIRYKENILSEKELTAMREAEIERSTKYLKTWIDGLERSMGETGIPKDMQAIIDDLYAGNIGETVRIGSSKSFASEKVNKLRETYKKHKGRYFSLDTAKSIDINARSIKYNNDVEEFNKKHRAQTVGTDFYRGASRLESSGGKRYWSTSWELFARSFEVYVGDKLAEKGQRNDYLTSLWKMGGTTNAELEAEGKKRYPRGDERQAINDAFDVLVNTLETKETDTGVAIYEPIAEYGSYEPEASNLQVRQADPDNAEQLGFEAGWGEDPLFLSKNADKKEAYSDLYGTVVRAAPVSELRASSNKIPPFNSRESIESLASIVSSIRKDAQESFYAIATDRDGNILRVMRHSKGTVNAASVYPIDVVAETASIEGAATLHLAHNHPSGDPLPSLADGAITNKINSLLDGTGIKAGHHVVIGKNKWHTVSSDDGGLHTNGRLKPVIRKTSIPVTERRFTKRGKLGVPVTDPSIARAATENHSDAIFLLNNQHEPVGIIQMSPQEMSTLREGGRVNRIFDAVNKTNARAVIIKTGNEGAARNIAKFVNGLGEISILDWLDSEGNSDAQEGGFVKDASGTFYSKSRGIPDGFASAEDAEAELRTNHPLLAPQIDSGKIVIVADSSQLPTGTKTRNSSRAQSAGQSAEMELTTRSIELAINERKGESSFARMDANDFLALTTSDVTNADQIKKEGFGTSNIEPYDVVSSEFDPAESNRTDLNTVPFIYIDENGKVAAHEGRHRAAALLAGGSTTIPVQIISADTNGVPAKTLTGQFNDDVQVKTPKYEIGSQDNIKAIKALVGDGSTFGKSEKPADLALESEKINPAQSQGTLFSQDSVIEGGFLDGIVYLVANANNKETLPITAWHEMSHAALDQTGGLEGYLTPEAHAKLFKKLENLKKLNEKRAVTKDSPFWREVQKRVDDANTPASKELDELAAYSTTVYLEGGDMPSGIRKWVKEFISALKAALFKHTGIFLGKLQPQDINAIARGYVSYINKGNQVIHGESELLGSAAAKGYKGDNPKEAKEWLDAVAKGLDMSKKARMQRAKDMGFDTTNVVSHVTKAESIKAFDNDYKTELSPFGFHFGTKEQAEKRATHYDFEGSGSIGDYILKLNNPLRVDHMASFSPDWLTEKMLDLDLITEERYEGITEETSYDDIETGDALVAILKNAGYDGLVYMNDGREGEGDSYVIFDTNNIRSINAAFDPDQAESASLLASMVERFNTFFSGMGRVLTDKMPNSISAKQLAKQLQNESLRGKWGIKAEEVEWTGIVEWLNEQSGKITKQEVQDFVKANQVQVEEVELGRLDSLYSELEEKNNGKDFDDWSELDQEEWMDAKGDKPNSTRYQSYTVDGEAENYRELLLTLPEKKQVKLVDKFGAEKSKPMSLAEARKKIAEAKSRGETLLYSEVLEDSYPSPHFDEPNILAHIRFDERTDANGDKVLFINEIQSDWHQSGRKKGYNIPVSEKEKLALQDEMFDLKKRKRAILEQFNTVPEDTPEYEALIDELSPIMLRQEEVNRQQRQIDSGSAGNLTPNAPFKGNAWVMLAMKRMIRHAAENGFDKVAWATGEQSADLYSLEKQVSKIYYTEGADGRFITGAEDLDGREIINSKSDGTAEELEAVYGKDIVEKMINKEGTKDGDTFILEGDGLKVGGEGMRGFYDKALPNLTQKYIKKWGGKVDDVNISTKAVPEGRTLQGEDLERAKQNGIITAQHGFTVTPEMRESAMKGQPLFSKAQPAIGNNGDFDRSSDDVLFSKRSTKGTNTGWREEKGFEGLDEETYEATAYIGQPPNRPIDERISEKWNEATDRWKTKLRQGVLDQYDSIKSVLGDKRSWMLAQMSGAAGGAVEMAIAAGKPFMHKDGVIQIDTASKSLGDIFRPLGNESQRFLMWIAANRAKMINERSAAASQEIEQLKTKIAALTKQANTQEASTITIEGRADNKLLRKQANELRSKIKELRKIADVKERLFDKEKIDALIDLNKNDNGVQWAEREATYETARKEFEEMHNAFVQIGVDTGLVSRKDAKVWKDQGFYVPFYRLADESADSHGVPSASGMVGQTAYKRLKGADMQLDDLLLNTVMNWEHLAGASLKNQAARGALQSAVDMGIAKKRKSSYGKNKNKGTKDVFVRNNGKEEWYTIETSGDGALLLESITSLNYNGMNNPAMKSLRKFKRLLTIGVTASPEFKVANLIRDTLQAIAVGDMSTNFVKNVSQGFTLTKPLSESNIQAIAAGGLFGDSGYINGGDPDAVKLVMAKAVGQTEILDTQHKIKRWWNAYQDFGARLENVNRISNIDQNLKRGQDRLSANFAGRDHLDFQRSGAFAAVRFLTQAIPFLNARAQGLDKISRAFADPEQRKQITAVLGTYAMASVLLYLYMKDDEDYQEAEQWERDTYHLIKLPNSDVMARIPRPFELGALANVVERGVEYFVDPNVEGKVFFERLQHSLSETFALSVIPQALAPAMEVRANRSSFTDRAIESQTMQRLSAVNRRKVYTSQTAIGMSNLMNAVVSEEKTLSPIQIDHLINGYFGWMGSTITTGIDLLARPMVGAPSEPSMQLQDYPVVGRFLRDAQVRNAKQVTQLYDVREELNRLFADIESYKADGDIERYKRELKKHAGDLRTKRAYNRAASRMSKLGKDIIRISKNKNLSPEVKRDRINRLNIRRIEIAKQTVDRFKPIEE